MYLLFAQSSISIWTSSINRDPVTYACYGTNIFSAPINQGLNPIIVNNATAQQIDEANCRHLLLRSHYNTCHVADKALRDIVLEVVHNIYRDTIKHDTFGFGQRTTINVMDHLWDTYYRVIDDDQFAENLEKIKSPWQPQTTIESLFTQLKDCQVFLF